MRDSPLVLVSDVQILIGSAGVMDMCDDRPNKAGDERISSNSAAWLGAPFWRMIQFYGKKKNLGLL